MFLGGDGLLDRAGRADGLGDGVLAARGLRLPDRGGAGELLGRGGVRERVVPAAPKQGTALGIYGAGNIGQSLAAFGAPSWPGPWAIAWGFWGFAVLTAVWLVVFAVLARNAPRAGPAKTLADFVRPLRERMSWVLSLYYFLTFGGFVAMADLPADLPDRRAVRAGAARRRACGRPGSSSWPRRCARRRVAGRPGRAGSAFCGGCSRRWRVFAVFLACPMMPTFTIGALGMAAAIGLGNGAVFKLVPEYFPKAVGSVTGLVGAAGGLGGFFPPLVLGRLQATGSFTGGFVLLALFSLGCLVVAGTGRRQPPHGCGIRSTLTAVLTRPPGAGDSTRK